MAVHSRCNTLFNNFGIAYSDATETKLAAIIGENVWTRDVPLAPIIQTEIDELQLALAKYWELNSGTDIVNLEAMTKLVCEPRKKLNLCMYTDSQVALWFVKRGSGKSSLPADNMARVVVRQLLLNRLINIDVRYIKLDENPADWYSRAQC